MITEKNYYQGFVGASDELLMIEEIVGDLEQGLVRSEVPAELGDQLRIQNSVSVRLIDRKSDNKKVEPQLYLKDQMLELMCSKNKKLPRSSSLDLYLLFIYFVLVWKV